MIVDHPYDEYNTLLVLVIMSTTILTSFIHTFHFVYTFHSVFISNTNKGKYMFQECDGM